MLKSNNSTNCVSLFINCLIFMHLPIALTDILQQIDILVPIENTLFGGPFV